MCISCVNLRANLREFLVQNFVDFFPFIIFPCKTTIFPHHFYQLLNPLLNSLHSLSISRLIHIFTSPTITTTKYIK